MLDERRMKRNRKWLEDDQARLQSQLSHMGTMMDERERPGLGTHMADNASEVFEQAKNLAVLQRLRRTLMETSGALDRMDKGIYGICERCGKAIDPARLKALPQARLCMRCQGLVEQGALSR